MMKNSRPAVAAEVPQRHTMLSYTGHPFIDVGAATLTAFAGKTRPEDLTTQDLENAADYMAHHYPSKRMNSFLTCVFPNSGYVNATSGAHKRQAFVDFHLYGFRQTAQADAPLCVACARPAIGRSFRQHVPMLTGEGILNFFPNGTPGLALCPYCLLCIAALPLGSLRCGGRALAVHVDDDRLTLEFAREHLQQNRRYLGLAELADDKLPNAREVRTRLVESLCNWARRQTQWQDGEATPVSVTAYHFSNSGQGPDLTLFQLPSSLVSFLRSAQRADHRPAWSAIARRAVRRGDEENDRVASRNYFYEDLFGLPDNAARFVRRYFLREAYRYAARDDPRADYRLSHELELVSWPLAELFLRKVLDMDQQRIDAIRSLGDRLADYICDQNDRRFWRTFYTTRRYPDLRNALLKASYAEIRRKRPPLIGLDDFIAVFEDAQELARTDWGFGRDLTLVRVIERLHERGYFAAHPEALPDEEEEDTAEAPDEGAAVAA